MLPVRMKLAIKKSPFFTCRGNFLKGKFVNVLAVMRDAVNKYLYIIYNYLNSFEINYTKFNKEFECFGH